jgi:hypothetical protein
VQSYVTRCIGGTSPTQSSGSKISGLHCAVSHKMSTFVTNAAKTSNPTQCQISYDKKLNYTPWPEYASELYRSSDRRLSAKLVPSFADRECHVVDVTDLYGRILGFLERSRYFSFK